MSAAISLEALVVGNVYFTLFFHDERLLMPEIATLIYLGRDLGKESGTLWFQTAESYTREGNWHRLTAPQRDELPEDALRLFDAEHADPICDLGKLAAELQEWQDRSNGNAAA